MSLPAGARVVDGDGLELLVLNAREARALAGIVRRGASNYMIEEGAPMPRDTRQVVAAVYRVAGQSRPPRHAEPVAVPAEQDIGTSGTLETAVRDIFTVSTAEAADWLGITERAVRKKIDAGRLPATRDGRRHRIHIDDLHDEIERRASGHDDRDAH